MLILNNKKEQSLLLRLCSFNNQLLNWHCQGYRLIKVKGNRKLDDSIESKVLSMAFSLAAEIKRDFISARTEEALKARKAKGIKLGRPQGAGKSKLDSHREKIVTLLQVRAEKKFIAEKLGRKEGKG